MAEDTMPLPTFGGRLANFAYSGDGDNNTSPSPARSLRSRSIPAPQTRSASGSPSKPPSRASPRLTPGNATKRKLEDGEAADGGVTLGNIPQFSRPTPSTSAVPSPSPSPTKRSRSANRARAAKPSKYAPPTTYAHLPLLPDAIAPNLLVLFVGLNPGIETARSGHAYAHPSNLFWKLMYSSGVLPERCTAQEDRTLPARFQLGLTNIVARPSRNGAELKAAELDAGVAILEAKARRWRPEVMCFVGKGIWDSIVRVRARQGRPKPEFKYGWQDESENMGVGEADDDDDEAARTVKEEILGDEEGTDSEAPTNVRIDPDWKGARVFVASSTSGLAASLLPAEKEAIWRQLGEWVEKRREELKETA